MVNYGAKLREKLCFLDIEKYMTKVLYDIKKRKFSKIYDQNKQNCEQKNSIATVSQFETDLFELEKFLSQSPSR